MPARARIHGGNELKTGRKTALMTGTGDVNLTGFQGFAHHLEDASVELRQLVEKQHPVVCQ